MASAPDGMAAIRDGTGSKAAGALQAARAEAPAGGFDRARFERERAQAKQLDAPPRLALAPHILAALRRPGRGAAALVGEILRLNLGPGRLTPAEYFYYRLDEPGLALEEKRKFVGKRRQGRLHAACNAPSWLAVADDKLLCQAVLQGHGFPVPRLLGLYHRRRRAGALPNPASPQALARFLAEQVAVPFFAKPVDGMYSLGAVAVEGRADGGETLLLAGGERVSVQALAAYMNCSASGYLFQETMRPHSELARAFGPRVSTVRMLVLLGSAGPELFRAVAKIPLAANIADNFWRKGNMIGDVEVASGRIRRAVSGIGLERREHPLHPDSGQALPGLALPLWEEARALCLAAAETLPGIRTQSWDVALTDKGPLLVELNAGGDLNLTQLASGRGVLDARFHRHLAECGVELD